MRLFLDASVLIAMARPTARDLISRQLLSGEHTFIGSDYLALELLPKPTAFKRDAETRFYRAFLENAVHIGSSSNMLNMAFSEACALGLSALDALHLAAAQLGAAEQLITLERREKPMYRSRLVRVTHLDDLVL